MLPQRSSEPSPSKAENFCGVPDRPRIRGALRPLPSRPLPQAGSGVTPDEGRTHEGLPGRCAGAQRRSDSRRCAADGGLARRRARVTTQARASSTPALTTLAPLANGTRNSSTGTPPMWAMMYVIALVREILPRRLPGVNL